MRALTWGLGLQIMMHHFLTDHRDELIEGGRVKVSQRPSPVATNKELEHGVPLFLEQLIKTLRVEKTSTPINSRKVSGPSGGS